ncbi:MAG: methyl-accepting chemotaxis protein [Gemmatimonadetes bacterium]|nr:methyl-accepting chemotaxis protein [Gemmatimonadota bacterium]
MSLASPTAPSGVSLHRRFLVGAGIAGALVILTLATGATVLLRRDVAQEGDARVAQAAERSSIVVEGALEERGRQATVLAMMPEVVAAAREGTARARALGLPGQAISVLEKRFDAGRSMLIAPTTRLLLRDLLEPLDAVDMILTDANGYNAVLTDHSSDFVQYDETWWQVAWRDGISPGDAAFDAASRQFTVSLAALVNDGETKVGVLKIKSSVAPLVHSLELAGAGIRIDVLDTAGRILLSSDSAAIGTSLRGMPSGRGVSARAATVMTDSVAERVAVLRANSGGWRVVAHLSERNIEAPYRVARLSLYGASAALIVVLVALLAAMNGFLERRISMPTRELADAAEAVAAGDFSVELRPSANDDEIGRLSRAVGAMIFELGRLARALAESARETSERSTDITAGSEEMAAAAGEIAHTASDLSVQSTSMAESIASLATAAAALQKLALSLDAGARDGVARNSTLRALALENRAGLDASAESLGALAGDVNENASAVAALAVAGEEIRSFVTLVRKLARQSKLLALNAAMEAARAGTHGAGFAVVATEVRRLASMSTDAAEHTEKIVNGILKGIDRSQQSSGRAVSTADDVRVATAKASASFAEIERAVAESESWTSSIGQTSAATAELVREMTFRLDLLAGGTEAFAAAMEEVAASSEQQSASTEEIAAGANALAAAAERLLKLVGGLKLG